MQAVIISLNLAWAPWQIINGSEHLDFLYILSLFFLFWLLIQVVDHFYEKRKKKNNK